VKALGNLPAGPTARRDKLVELVETAAARDVPALVLACETFVRNSPQLALDLVEALAEREVHHRIAALGLRLHESPPPNTSAKLARAFARLVNAHTGERPEPAAVRPTVASHPTPLLDEVVANPDDDGPRAVYADWLTERGDLRGELITLQLARVRRRPTSAAKEREKELIANHRTELLGPFAHCAKRTGLKFDRGFVVNAIASAPWPAAPETALLERLDIEHHELALDVELASLIEIANYELPIASLLDRAPRLRAVRYLRTYEPAYLGLFVNRAPRSVDDITISTWGASQTRDGFVVLAHSPLARSARRLEVRVSWPGESTIATLLALVPARCTTFVYDVVSHVEMRFELTRIGDRWSLAAEISKLQPAQFDRLETELARHVGDLPPLAAASFVARSPNARAAITRAVASIPGATVR
jgi:uncharacterized protein (TIGR02996 family)